MKIREVLLTVTHANGQVVASVDKSYINWWLERNLPIGDDSIVSKVTIEINPEEGGVSE